MSEEGTMNKGMYGELPTDPCIFAACDHKYFNEHAPAFVQSADKANVKAIHIHVVNPLMETFALATLLNSLTKARITYTFHDTPVPDAYEKARTLYACTRFLVLPQIVRTAKKVLTLDIDCMVMQPFEFPNTPVGYFPREPIGSGDWETEGTKVAAGAVYVTENALQVCDAIHEQIQKVPLRWFADQIVLNAVMSQVPEEAVTKFDGQFMDWEFKEGTTIWTGKGARKHDNPTYVAKKNEMSVLETSKYGQVILKPRLDLPFKMFGLSMRNEVNEPIRDHWSNFVDRMVEVLSNDHEVLIIESPNWMHNNRILNHFPATTVVYVPHGEKGIWDGDDRTKYYMQTVFPWLFTVDPSGYAGSSQYQHGFFDKGGYSTDCFDELSEYLKAGGTKFAHLQPEKGFRHSDLLKDEFIFVPLQIPHDTVIQNHSPITCEEFVKALCEWAEKEGNPQVVFKGHPVNAQSMLPLMNIIEQYDNVLFLTDCHIHDMIEKSAATYVINSGTGQEAMLLDKTVVVFGSCDYQRAVITGDIADLDKVWSTVKVTDQKTQQETYRRWYHWFGNTVFDSREQKVSTTDLNS